MTYQVIAPATTTLVSVAELKTHLLLFGDNSYDTELQDTLLAAEGFVSDFLGDFLSSTTVRINLPVFSDTTLPHKNPTNLHVAYWDQDDLEAPFNASHYTVDASADYPRIVFKTTPSNTTSTFTNKGLITYDTTLDPVPAKIKRAVLLIAAELFENRNNSSEKKMEKVPLTAMRLMQSARGW